MKKNLIDKVLLEWSYRCDDGVPDINDPKKLKVLKEMLKLDLFEKTEETSPPEDFKNALIDLINNTPEKNLGDKIFKSLYKRLKNYKNNTLEELKIELEKRKIGSLYKAVYNMAEDFGEADDLLQYLKFEPKPSFSSIESNNAQNLVTIAKPYLNKPNHVSEELFRTFMSKGDISIGNVSMGKGELAFILLFNDIVKSFKKGDLNAGGKTVEIKGTNSRIALEKRKLSSQSSKQLIIPILKKYFNEKEYPINFSEKWMDSIKTFYTSQIKSQSSPELPLTEEEKNFKKDLESKFKLALKDIYGKDFDIDENKIKDFFEKSNGVSILQKEITLKLMDEFLQELTKSLKSSLLLLNSSNGNFIYLENPTIEQLEFLIKNNKIKITGFSDELPRINYIG